MISNSLENRKADLMKQISRLKNEENLRRLEELIQQLENSDNEKRLVERYTTRIKDKIDLNELIKDQHWKPVDRKKFDKLVKELDIKEPIEQLLADI